jgi:hypothetical protein
MYNHHSTKQLVMKKILFAVMIIAGIAACNSPQEITTTNSDSSVVTAPTDSAVMGNTPTTDTVMQGDTMKRDTTR